MWVVIAEADLSPGLCKAEWQRDHSRPKGLLQDPAGCATLAVAAAMKNSGVRCRGGFEKASTFLIGGPDVSTAAPAASPLQRRSRCSKIVGFSCEFSGTVSRSCRLGMRAP